MYTLLKKILQIISAEDRNRLGILLFINTLSSISGIAGIAAVVPFMYVLSDPGKIFTTPQLKALYVYSGFSETHSFVLLSGALLLFALTASNILSAAAEWYNINTARSISLNLSRGMMKTYLEKDYSFFLTRNSSDLVKNLFSEAALAVTRVIQPFIEMVSKVVFVVFIMIFLAWITPSAVYVSIGALASLSALIYLLIRKKLKKSGTRAVESNRERFHVAGEAFGAFREIKLYGYEKFFIDKFTKAAGGFESEYAALTAMSRLPKYAIEILAFGGLLGASLSMYNAAGGIHDALPFMALYAFAGYRVLPAAQQILSVMAGIRGSSSSIDLLHSELYLNQAVIEEKNRASAGAVQAPASSLRLEGVSFSYEEQTREALSEINIEIRANETVGFAGPTGCGKTTLIDLIAGLHRPARGRVITDETELNDSNISAWRRKIGYVPQQIYLTDDSVRRNIAFGINDSDIDMQKVIQAARAANIHEFITKKLDRGYDSIVGERGARLSGGEGQRIAIARALYRDPDIIIFDEATSALDSETEAAVMDAIDALNGKKTILIAAHRFSTLKKCSKIFTMKEGRIVSVNPCDELVNPAPVYDS